MGSKKKSRKKTPKNAAPFSFGLTKNEIAALLMFASTDETRLHLFGLGLSSGYVAACDGHRLLFKRVPGATGERVVCGYLVRDALKLLQKPKDAVTFTVESDGTTTAQVYQHALKSTSRCRDAVYPPIRHVIPKPGDVDSPVRKMCVTTKYAFDVERAAAKLGCDDMTIRFGAEELSPIVYTLGASMRTHQWGVVLMPRRGNDSGDEVLAPAAE